MDFISHTKKTRFADYKTALEGKKVTFTKKKKDLLNSVLICGNTEHADS